MVKFGFTHKFLKKVMSILDKIKQNENNEDKKDVQLNKQELEFLLLVIKESTFKGEHIESLYALVYKLQQQYQNR